MNEIVVVSGKGGTGKTSVTAVFAALADQPVLCDADVDAADLHLLTAPQPRDCMDFSGGGVALIDPDRCTQCDLCRHMCRFEAIDDHYVIDGIACEGCGVCVDFCPERAIAFSSKICGQWYISDTRFGPMVHARLGIAEENSGKLVSLVRREARALAEATGSMLILTDGPPGVGCPVIAAIGGATTVVIVAEPSVSGLHDMRRVAQLAAHFRVPAMVCINKADVNPQVAKSIDACAQELNLIRLGRIPFDPAVTQAMVQGKNVIEWDAASPASVAIADIWHRVLETLVVVAQ